MLQMQQWFDHTLDKNADVKMRDIGTGIKERYKAGLSIDYQCFRCLCYIRDVPSALTLMGKFEKAVQAI